MSGGTPTNVVPASGTAVGAITGGATKPYGFLFQDENNKPLPAGTTISAATVGTGLTINPPSSFTVPCTGDPTTYSFSVTAGSTYAGGGSLRLEAPSSGGGSPDDGGCSLPL